MNISDTVAMTWHFIRGRPLESILVVLGIALGIGIISGTIALTRLFPDTMRGGFQARTIRVYAGEEVRGDFNSPLVKLEAAQGVPAHLNLEDIQAAIKVSPHAPYGFFQALVSESKGDSPEDVISVVTSGYFPAHGLKVAKGLLFTPNDENSGAHVAVLGSQKAELLFPGQDAVGKSIQVFGLSYTVIGVLAPVDDKSLYEDMPPDALPFVSLGAAPIFQKLRYPGELTFMASDDASLESAVREIKAYFATAYPQGGVSIEAEAEQMRRRTDEVRSVFSVILLLAGSGLLIANINIFNVMMARVARRTRNIGISAAIGASRRKIFLSHLVESLLLCAGGSVVGIGFSFLFTALLGVVLSAALDRGQKLVMDIGVLGESIGLAVAISLLFGIYPAYRAARVDPSEALRVA